MHRTRRLIAFIALLVLAACVKDAGAPSANPPRAPGDVRAAVVESGIEILWRDDSDDEDGFRIYRADRSGPGDPTLRAIGTTAAGTTTYLDTAAQAGVAYRYAVSAYRGANESARVEHGGDPVEIAPPTGSLAVELLGSGTGTVTSTPAGIDCGAACTAQFELGATVTLTAIPAPPSVFAGWSGGCTGSDATCTIAIDEDVAVRARFSLEHALEVSKTGSGAGAVDSDPAGIACGETCSATFPDGTDVVLTATPEPDSTFEGWTGSCRGTERTCTVTLDAAKSVGASFGLVVAADPAVASFEASPSTTAPGGEVTLAWTVTNANEVTLEPGGVDVTEATAADGRGSTTVTPAQTTTYTLVARNAAGATARAETTVTVREAPTIVEFGPVLAPAADGRGDLRVNPGLEVALAWRVTGADAVTLEGPGLGAGVEVDPTSGTTLAAPRGASYTLRATNPSGTATRSVAPVRAAPAFGFLIAGQSNAQGRNLPPAQAMDYITADADVRMLGNDYRWKGAYEPLDDCTDQVDAVSRDPAESCTGMGNSGVSLGVALGNELHAATGSGVYLIPAAYGGSSASQWQPPGCEASDPGCDYRSYLYGSAVTRGRLAASERGAPLDYAVDGRAYGALVWFQGESDSVSFDRASAYRYRTDRIFDAFAADLADDLAPGEDPLPIVFVQLARRQHDSDDETAGGVGRNQLYQVVREAQRSLASGARLPSGAVAPDAEPNRYLVVTHDLPLEDEGADDKHLSAAAQVELGRRVALAVRQHLLGEAGVDGTGPRLDRVEKTSATTVRVLADRQITAPAANGPDAYSGYFAVFADSGHTTALAVAGIERDPGNSKAVLITLAAPASGEVYVRYMPPEGELSSIAVDVVRAATCAEPIPSLPGTVCLPLPAFGASTGSPALRSLQFPEDDVR